jgi:hypothetical protein
MMRFPAKMAMNDSVFFILDLGQSDYFIKCFSYLEFEHICSLFKRGNGPEEYISINNIQCINDTLYAFGISEVYCLDTKRIQSGNLAVNRIKMNGNYGFLNRGIKVADKFYFPFFNILNQGKILQFDESGNFISAIGSIKPRTGETITSAICQAWVPFIDGRDSVIATATQFGEILDVFKGNSQITMKGQGDYPVFKTVDSYAVPDGIFGFHSVYVTSDCIYTVFNGEQIKDSKEEQQGGRYIYVYDFGGNPVKRIILDHFCVSLIIDEKSRNISLLDANKDNPLYMTSLPQ